METIHGLAELEAIVGKEIGSADWFTVDQARVNGFADDTEDHVRLRHRRLPSLGQPA